MAEMNVAIGEALQAILLSNAADDDNDPHNVGHGAAQCDTGVGLVAGALKLCWLAVLIDHH